MSDLKAYIEQELIAIEECVNQILDFRLQTSTITEENLQRALISAIALSLQAFYTGTERIFLTVAKEVDQSLPSGNAWHRSLLLQMASALPNIRDAVISEELLAKVDEFRRFRHVVRSNYAHILDADRVLDLADEFPDFFDTLRKEVMNWINNHCAHS